MQPCDRLTGKATSVTRGGRRLYLERFRPRHVPLVLLARSLGWDVLLFNLDRSLRTSFWARWLLDSTRAQTALNVALVGTQRAAIEGGASIGTSLITTRAGRALNALLGPDAELVVQRVAAEMVATATFVAARIAADGGGVLVPHDFLVIRREVRGHPTAGVNLESVVTLGFEITSVVRAVPRVAIRALVVLARVGARWLLTSRSRSRAPRSTAPIGVAISSAFHLKFDGPRRFDFIVDGSLIRPEDVLFLFEVPRASHDGPGLRFVDLHGSTSLKAMRRSPLSGEWRSATSHAMVGLLPGILGSRVIVAAAEAAFAGHVAAAVLLARVDLRKYVFSNKEAASQIAQNAMLRASGVETLNYSMFIGGPYLFDHPRSTYDQQNVLWSFLNPDVWFVNNLAMAENFASHRQRVGRYEVIGNIFGEMIVGLVEQPGWRPIVGWDTFRSPERGAVAVFDTTYIPDQYSLTDFADAGAFLGDIARLAEQRPDIDFALKPSKEDASFVAPDGQWSSPGAGSAVLAARDRLRAMPNVRWLSDSSDPTVVIAESDAVITHCFSSPTADALAGGRPAMWYEPGDKHRGFPLDLVPDLVAHGYAELEAGLAKLIDGRWRAPSDVPAYRYLVDPGEGPCGLTRLRSLLAQPTGAGWDSR